MDKICNNIAKHVYDEEKNDFVIHDIKGNPGTHAVVVAGYRKGEFLIVDPDYEHGGRRRIDAGRLIGAIYLAQTDYDSLVITLDGDTK